MPAQHAIQVLAGDTKSRSRLRLRHWRLAFAMLVLFSHNAGHVTVTREVEHVFRVPSIGFFTFF